MSIEQKRAVAMMIGIELWTCKRMQYAKYFLIIGARRKRILLFFQHLQKNHKVLTKICPQVIENDFALVLQSCRESYCNREWLASNSILLSWWISNSFLNSSYSIAANNDATDCCGLTTEMNFKYGMIRGTCSFTKTEDLRPSVLIQQTVFEIILQLVT